MNTAALVLGVVGIMGLPLGLLHPLAMVAPIACSVLAVVFGFTFRRRVSQGQTQGPTGLATAGVVLGIVQFAFLTLGTIWLLSGLTNVREAETTQTVEFPEATPELAPSQDTPAPIVKKAMLSDVTTEDIAKAADAGGWTHVSTEEMDMGSMISSELTLNKDDAEAVVQFVRPSGRPDAGGGAAEPIPMPAAKVAEVYGDNGAAFARDKSMLGVRIGADKTAADALLADLKAALLSDAN